MVYYGAVVGIVCVTPGHKTFIFIVDIHSWFRGIMSGLIGHIM